MVDDRSGGGLLERLHDAPGRACGRHAVHALALREAVLARGALDGRLVDDREARRGGPAARREHGGVAGLLGGREAVRLGARGLAGAAADAARRVDEDADGVPSRRLAWTRTRARGSRPSRPPPRPRRRRLGGGCGGSGSSRPLLHARRTRLWRVDREESQDARSASGTVAIMTGPPSRRQALGPLPRLRRRPGSAGPSRGTARTPRRSRRGTDPGTRAGLSEPSSSSGRRRKRASRLLSARGRWSWVSSTWRPR